MYDRETWNKIINRQDVQIAILISMELKSLLKMATGKSPIFKDPIFSPDEKKTMKLQARQDFVWTLQELGIDLDPFIDKENPSSNRQYLCLYVGDTSD